MNYYLNARRDALDHNGLFKIADNKERVHRFDKNLAGKIRRGDIIKYKDHVSMVYSDRPTCNDKGEDCKYQIIHAYGVNSYKKIINGDEQRIFSRKVLVTPNDISTTIKNPTGFGRIKLWD